MSSTYLEVKDALNSALGPTSTTNVQTLTAATQVLISSGPGEVTDICFVASATVGQINLGFVDASATATGTAPFFKIGSVAAGIWPVNLNRPISFTRGLVLSYTASGGSTVDVNTVFTPRNVSNSSLPWGPGLR